MFRTNKPSKKKYRSSNAKQARDPYVDPLSGGVESLKLGRGGKVLIPVPLDILPSVKPGRILKDPGSRIRTPWQVSQPLQQFSDERGRPFVVKRLLGRRSKQAADEDVAEDDGYEDEGNGEENEDDDEREDGEDEEDDRFKDYKRSSDPRREYVFGRVIEVACVPFYTENATRSSRLESGRQMPAGVQARICRFVIIRSTGEGGTGFSALPIKTYNGLGVAATGVVKAHHAIIWTRAPPTMTQGEYPSNNNGTVEAGMQRQSIRVNPYDLTRPLDSMARLNFFDIHEFEDDVDNVKLYGKVHKDSRASLFFQYRSVWQTIDQSAMNQAPRSEGQASGAFMAPESNSPRPTVPVPPGDQAVQNFRNIMAALRTRGQSLYLSALPDLSAAQQDYLARNQHARVRFVSSIAETWRNEAIARQAAAPAAVQAADDGDSEEDQEGEDDGSEDEDEDEEDDEDDEDEENEENEESEDDEEGEGDEDDEDDDENSSD